MKPDNYIYTMGMEAEVNDDDDYYYYFHRLDAIL